MTLYGSSILGGAVPAGQPLEIEGASQPGAITKNGLVLYGSDGKAVSDAGTRRIRMMFLTITAMDLTAGLSVQLLDLLVMCLLHRCW